MHRRRVRVDAGRRRRRPHLHAADRRRPHHRVLRYRSRRRGRDHRTLAPHYGAQLEPIMVAQTTRVALIVVLRAVPGHFACRAGDADPPLGRCRCVPWLPVLAMLAVVGRRRRRCCRARARPAPGCWRRCSSHAAAGAIGWIEGRMPDLAAHRRADCHRQRARRPVPARVPHPAVRPAARFVRWWCCSPAGSMALFERRRSRWRWATRSPPWCWRWRPPAWPRWCSPESCSVSTPPSSPASS